MYTMDPFRPGCLSPVEEGDDTSATPVIVEGCRYKAMD
jgi:hypothetical protein